MKITPRDYQYIASERVVQSYKENKKRLLIVLATGLGKTFLATLIHEQKIAGNKKTLFLVDRKELVDQTKEAFEQFDSTLKVGVEMNVLKADKDCDVVVASVQTLGKSGSVRIKRFNPKDYGLIIVDEAHGSVTESWIRVLSYFGVGPNNEIEDKLLIGLTATPNRTDGIPLGKIYDDIVVNYDLSFGMRNGWLTDIEFLKVETKVDISKIKATKKDFDNEELEKAINVASRNALVVKSYIEHSNDENAIVFCNSVEHAYELEAMFNEHNIPAKCIEAETPSDERKEWIALFKRGRIRVLLNYGTLTTGFNAPETSTIILARPIKSELLLRQIIGRGLRPSSLCFIDFFKTPEQRLAIIEGSVKPACKVIDLCDIVGNHDIVSVPSLFGLNPNLDIKDKKRLFKEVVEPLEEIKHKHQINTKLIMSIDEIESIVTRKKIDLKSVNLPKVLTDFTDKPWVETGDEVYEIFYPADHKSLVVSQNMLDKWDLIEYDTRTHVAKKLNDFYDLSGAIKIGDEYAMEMFEHKPFMDNTSWMAGGVTRKQRMLLQRILKGGIQVIPGKFYDDSKEPVLRYRKTGEILNAGSAHALLSVLTSKK